MRQGVLAFLSENIYNIPCLWCVLCATLVNQCNTVKWIYIYMCMHQITNWFSKVSTKMQRPCKGAIELLKGWHHDFKAIFSCKKEQKQRKVELHEGIQYLIFPKLKPLENCKWFWNRFIYNYWTEILPRAFLFQRVRQQQIPQFSLNSFVSPSKPLSCNPKHGNSALHQGMYSILLKIVVSAAILFWYFLQREIPVSSGQTTPCEQHVP